MHQPGVKCVQANTCPCWADNCPCTISFPSENCCNRVPMQEPTAPRLTTNVIQNTEEAQGAAPILCQATHPWPSFIQTHWRSCPSPSQEDPIVLNYWLTPSLPTRHKRSPRPPPPTPPNQRALVASK